MTQQSTNTSFFRQTNQVENGPNETHANSVEFLTGSPPALTTNPKRIWVDMLNEEFKYTVDGVDIHTLLDGQNLGIVSVKWFGAKGDNSEDDTAYVQQAVDYFASGSGVIFFPPGEYRVSSVIINQPNITITGVGATIVMIDDELNAFQLVDAPGFYLYKLDFTTEYSGVTVSDYEGQAVYGYGDNLIIEKVKTQGTTFTIIFCENPTIHDCVVDGSPNTTNNGILFRACSNYKAISNRVSNVAIDGIKSASLNAGRSPSGVLELTSYGVMSFNSISGFGDDGIDIYDNGRKNIIVNNTIDGLNGGNLGINVKSQGNVPEVDLHAEWSIVSFNQIHNVPGFIQVGGSNYNIIGNIMTKPTATPATNRRGVTIGVDALYPIVKNINFSNNMMYNADLHGVEVGSFALDVELNENHIYNPGGFALALGGDGVQVQGGLYVDAGGDRFINVNPLNTGSGMVTLANLRIVNRASATATFGFRVAATNSKVVSVVGCHVQNVATPFRDDSGTSNQVANSWQGRMSGTTAQRPITLTTFHAGTMYWDSTLVKPIWWSGTNWRDATGAVV